MRLMVSMECYALLEHHFRFSSGFSSRFGRVSLHHSRYSCGSLRIKT
jgi:hypothetical protein